MIGKVFLSVIAIACFHGACATLTSDESIAACDANSCPERKSLLQAKSRPTSVSFVAHTKSHKVSHVADTKSACQLNISGDPDATGNTATLDEAGFIEVRACSCPAQMREFIRRLVLADSNAVCHEGGLEGLTLFYYSGEYPENDFTSLQAAVGPGGAAQTDTTCPWIAPTDQCDTLNFGSCPSFPDATNPPCEGCIETTTVTTTTMMTTTTFSIDPLCTTIFSFQSSCRHPLAGHPTLPWIHFAYFGGSSTPTYTSGSTIGSPNTDGTDFVRDCSLYSSDTIMRVIMGTVDDYFKPASSSTFCEMLNSYTKHQFSSDQGATWVTPSYYHAHLGGSARYWPKHNVEGDDRNYISFWAAPHHPGHGGCCWDGTTYAWKRPFHIYVKPGSAT